MLASGEHSFLGTTHSVWSVVFLVEEACMMIETENLDDGISFSSTLFVYSWK